MIKMAVFTIKMADAEGTMAEVGTRKSERGAKALASKISESNVDSRVIVVDVEGNALWDSSP